MILDLVEAGQLSAGHAADVIGRDDHHEVSDPPNLVAGRLLRATTHPNARQVMRHAILEDPARQQLTRKRYAQTVGPQLLAVYRDVPGKQKNAVAALTTEFQPASFTGASWSIRDDRSVRDVLAEALACLEEQPDTVSDPAVELCARSLGALASLGLVYSDQGSQVNDESWLRGSVAKVLTYLMRCAGGLTIMCEAAERAEDANKLMPRLYTADGTVVCDEGGHEVHLHPEQGANLQLRELAFRAERTDEDDHEDDDETTPYDRFVGAQKRAALLTEQLGKLVDDLLDIRDTDDRPFADKLGLDRALLGEVPNKLNEMRDYVLLALADEPEPDEALDEQDSDELEAIADALVGADVALDDAA